MNRELPIGYTTFCSFSYNRAETYGDMRLGHRDSDKRALIREDAHPILKELEKPREDSMWGFIIEVEKRASKKAFDIENVPKLIIDSFCGKQMEKDKSICKEALLYRDDTLDHVQYLEVHGKRGPKDKTTVTVIYKPKEAFSVSRNSRI